MGEARLPPHTQAHMVDSIPHTVLVVTLDSPTSAICLQNFKAGTVMCQNAWTNMLNKMMEEKAGVKRHNSKKGFEKNAHACNVEGVFVVSDPSARQYLKVASPTRKIQSSSKLQPDLKWKSEIPDTLLGSLIGIVKIQNVQLQISPYTSNIKGCRALEKSLTRTQLFCIFHKSEENVANQKAQRQYNQYKLCPLARPSNVGKSVHLGPGQTPILQNRGSMMVMLCSKHCKH